MTRFEALVSAQSEQVSSPFLCHLPPSLPLTINIYPLNWLSQKKSDQIKTSIFTHLND